MTLRGGHVWQFFRPFCHTSCVEGLSSHFVDLRVCLNAFFFDDALTPIEQTWVCWKKTSTSLLIMTHSIAWGHEARHWGNQFFYVPSTIKVPDRTGILPSRPQAGRASFFNRPWSSEAGPKAPPGTVRGSDPFGLIFWLNLLHTNFQLPQDFWVRDSCHHYPICFAISGSTPESKRFVCNCVYEQ
jgi:hypothetical protein